MIQFEEAIVDLLLRHNCVIVPTFGGFVAQSTNATVDFRNGVMMPPRKSVLFNRQLINNDGLLLHYLSEKNNWDFNEASSLLKATTEGWHEQLKEGKRIVIDKIGYLYLDGERNIGFEQDRFFNLLLQSYGLSKVHFLQEEDVKLVEVQKQPEQTIVPKAEPSVPFKELVLEPEMKPIQIAPEMPESAAKVIPLVSDQKSKQAWKYLAAAALLPFAFYTYWIPMKTNVLESGLISTRDFNPAYQAGEGIYQKKGFSFSLKKEKVALSLEQTIAEMPTDVGVYYFKFADDLYIPVKIDRDQSVTEKQLEPITETVNVPVETPPIKVEAKPIETAKVPEEKPKVVAEVPKKEAPKKEMPKVEVKPEQKPTPTVQKEMNDGIMYLIVGGFATEENAKLLVEELKGKGFATPSVLKPKDGLYRVSAGTTTSNTQMAQMAAKAKNNGYEGWVLK